MYSTVLGVFHPVHSLQPQWGHFNIIHFFRNTLQTNWASGGKENTQSHLWLATLGDFCPFMSFWVIYMRPALTKMTFTVPMICTLLPQNDCIWTLICTLWLVKTKLASFYNVDSNVDTNKTRIACLNDFSPFYRQLRLNRDSWELKLMFQSVLRSFQKSASEYLRWQIIILQKCILCYWM